MGWGSLALASVLALLVWGILVVISARPSLPWPLSYVERQIIDMTPSQTVSVHRSTERLIADLQDRDGERIEIYTMFEPLLPREDSPQERALIAILRRVQTMTVGLLRQYSALGGEKVQVRDIDVRRDPDKFKEVEERLGGVKAKHVVVVAVVREDADGKEVIRKRVIPAIDMGVIDHGNPGGPGAIRSMPKLDDFVGEEQLSTAMKTLLAGGQPKVYFVENGRNIKKSDSVYYTALVSGLLADGFQVADVNLKVDGIPEDAAVLACMEPEVEFEDVECEAIHAFLKRGGRMFLNLTYHDVATRNPKLANLLGPLGVEVGDKMVAQLWQDPQQAPQLVIQPTNTSLPITRPLVAAKRTITLAYARPIRKQKVVEGISVEQSLLWTSDKCWLAERDSAVTTSMTPPHPRNWGRHYVGSIVTVQPEIGDHTGRLVLIGGLGFHDRMMGVGSQATFALSTFAWLADRVEHVAITPDGGRRKIAVIRRDPNPDVVTARLTRSRYFLLGGVPVSFLVLGLFVWWRRRRI